MLQLSRTVRFAINPQKLRSTGGADHGANGFAGSPPMRGLGRHYELEVTCAGDADPVTGYLVDIKDVDRSVRGAALPIIERACDLRAGMDPAELLPEIVGAVASALAPRMRSLRWRLTPYYSVEMTADDRQTVLLRQRFDLSASHRLNVPSLSAEENRRRFGKCNNPSGHGHNYQFEPMVAVKLDGAGRPNLTLEMLERLAEEAILRRFDHKNLTTDCPEFRPAPGEPGINATVENIARVFFDLLNAALKAAAPAASLRSITVWETDRTSATFPA